MGLNDFAHGNRFQRYLWAANILIILLISVFGRPVQHLAEFYVPIKWVGYAISGVLALAVLWWIVKIGRCVSRRKVVVGALVAAVAIALTANMERPEEKMHLLLFGAFGFLTLQLFGIRRGVLICLAVASIDELVQGIVPNRVADWHDVTLNSASALAGAVLGRCSVWP